MSRRLCSVAVAALALAAVAGVADAQENLRIGFDLAGDHEQNLAAFPTTQETETGITIGVETVSPGSRGSETGIGLEYQMPRGHDGDPGDKFSFLTVYVFARARLSPRRSSASLIGRFGYGLLDGNDDYLAGRDASGGLFYSFGLGMPLERSAELSINYSVNTGTLSGGIGDWDIEYSRIGVAASFAF